jgi:hypothetical protein
MINRMASWLKFRFPYAKEVLIIIINSEISYLDRHMVDMGKNLSGANTETKDFIMSSLEDSKQQIEWYRKKLKSLDYETEDE